MATVRFMMSAVRIGSVDDGCADYFVQFGGASAHVTVARDGTWRDPCPFVERTMRTIATKLAAAQLPAALSFEVEAA